MKNWRCWFRDHDLERVSANWPMVVPGAGVMIRYSPDPEGDRLACRRCRRILIDPKEET